MLTLMTLLKELTLLLKDLLILLLMPRACDDFCAMLLETLSISTGSAIRSVGSRNSRGLESRRPCIN